MTRINSSHVQSRTVLMLQGAAQHLRLPSSNGRQAAIQANHLTAHEVGASEARKRTRSVTSACSLKRLAGIRAFLAPFAELSQNLLTHRAEDRCGSHRIGL